MYGVDSTFSTPALLRPFEFGADIVMHSTTKYLSGHNQIIGGIVITNDSKINEQMEFIQKTIGAVPSPFDCWLTLLGLKTLSIRMDRHCSNGMAVAEFLENHSKVKSVSYPGLKSHLGHKVAKQQMDGFGGMISMELEGGIPAGILAVLSYGIVVWSMQYLEIAYVSSIRETSIIIATLIGFFILREKKAKKRMLPAILVVVGISIVYFQI